MTFLKRSARRAPHISLVLVDWSVRESFHFLHYLALQTIPREQFEVIVIEYYDRRSLATAAFEHEIDTWALLEMPAATYYHKHLMYNAGIVLAKGEIVLIGDSDAMVRESFLQSILAAFEAEPNIVLHLDQFRNNRQDLYPFRFPSFEEVLGPGCINNADGVTTGLVDRRDPLHSRNYGACMCARRQDLIAIGGADEHIDYLGHICGPYDMTFRLLNAGRREVWHQREFLYHTWHPGTLGVDNYLGPHDGRQMSSTALDALATGRLQPLVENRAIRALRLGEAVGEAELIARLIDPSYANDWRVETIQAVSREPRWRLARYATTPAQYKGHRIERTVNGYVAAPIALRGEPLNGKCIEGGEIGALLAAIDRRAPVGTGLLTALGACLLFAGRVVQKLMGRQGRAE